MGDIGSDQPEPAVPGVANDIEQDDLGKQQRDIQRIDIRACGQATVHAMGSPILFA